MIEKVNIAQKLTLFNDLWSPKIVGEINNFHVKVVKVEGEFDWHHHDDEDEMFLIIKGSLLMQLRDQEDVVVNEGEFIIIPHGVEHRPVAQEECHLVLIEPQDTLNTGNVETDHTVKELDRL